MCVPVSIGSLCVLVCSAISIYNVPINDYKLIIDNDNSK